MASTGADEAYPAPNTSGLLNAKSRQQEERRAEIITIELT